MAPKGFSPLLLCFCFLISSINAEPHMPLDTEPLCPPTPPIIPVPIFPYDVDLLQFALNIEFTECEFFLFATLGRGLDSIDPKLAFGGPPPIGAMKANLDALTWSIILEFAYQEVGHLRAITSTVGGAPRPLIDLSVHNFAVIMDEAFGYPLHPPFNPYIDSLNYLLASYVIPYLGIVGYVGANPNTNGFVTKRLLAGLLGIEAGQDAIIRGLLYQRAEALVPPYNITVAEFTSRISELRNRLADCGIKDEGVIVPPELGAEHSTSTNTLVGNALSLSFQRTPAEILRIMYETGDEHHPGGLLPEGGTGKIARSYLKA